jgi:diguanylate cyclase (GGDEF)-like protein
MASSTPPVPPSENRSSSDAVKASLSRLDRHESRTTRNATVIIILLAVAIGALSLPNLLQNHESPVALYLNLALRGLLAVVLVLNVYGLYQQHLLQHLRDALQTHIELAGEEKARAEAYYELSILDPLTGLYNRRFSQERLEAEIARANRHNMPLAVILFDLDKFKKINDRYGHAAGDLALKEFARHLNKAIRGSDFAVRTGGDEFMVVLPECPPEKVQRVLSRVVPFEIELAGNRIPIAASRGFAQYQPPESAEEVMRRADAALYQQKVAILKPVRGHKYGQPKAGSPARIRQRS